MILAAHYQDAGGYGIFKGPGRKVSRTLALNEPNGLKAPVKGGKRLPILTFSPAWPTTRR